MSFQAQAQPSDHEFRQAVKSWIDSGETQWQRDRRRWGAPPKRPGCRVPPHILREFRLPHDCLFGADDPPPKQQDRKQADAAGATKQPAKDKPTWRDKLINVQELCDMRFAPLKYVVPTLIPEGVTLLASRPKLGKSWALLQICSAVASGTATLVESDQPPHGDVLYCALEDNRRRLQRRLTKYFGADRTSWPARLTLATEWARLDRGGVAELREWCGSVEKPTLIAIDTLKKIRAPKRNGQSDYDADYEACQGLQELAGEFGISIIVAHHDRKMEAEDVFDTVSGTLGLTGGVDAIAMLKRRGLATVLYIQGRDLPDAVEKAVSLDRETCRWHILGEAAEVVRSSERVRVIAALRAGPPEGLSVAEIKIEADFRSRGAADKLVQRMAKSGEIERRSRGKYGLPCTSLSEVSESPKDQQAVEETGVNAASDTSDTSDRGM
jgi:hypothetical protein